MYQMAYSRLLIVLAIVLLSVSACSTGHYRNKIAGSYGSSFRNGLQASKERDYEQAAVHYAFASKSGHPRTLIAYAELLASGRGIERDPVLANQLLEDAYGKSSNYKSRAALSLGRLLIDGGEGPSGTLQPDQTRALTLLDQALDGGETRAALVLGKIYNQGIGTDADPDRAIGYYNRVASENAMAARQLALLLAETGAPEKQVAEAADSAVNQLERQAKEGKGRVWVLLADIFMRDEIIDPDPERAIAYLGNVADDDDPAVLTRLATLYGEIGDPVLERSMLRKAADKGDKKAQTRLAKLFLRAGTGDTNGSVGRYYAEKAIAQGSEAAMAYLGVALIRGGVLKPDLEIGEALLRRSSTAGNNSGTAALGVALLRNEIKPRFPGEGKKLLKTAANNGSAGAMSALGFAYHNGQGLPQDDAAALLWLQRAADAGSPRAKRFLSEQAGA